MSRSGSEGPAGGGESWASASSDPGLARDRTTLAWTRSALNLATIGVLIARAGFVARLDLLGVLSAIAMGAIALLTWRYSHAVYRDRGGAGRFPHHQPAAIVLLTAATLFTGAVALIVTIAV